jgi:hypothetical protein
VHFVGEGLELGLDGLEELWQPRRRTRAVKLSHCRPGAALLRLLLDVELLAAMLRARCALHLRARWHAWGRHGRPPSDWRSLPRGKIEATEEATAVPRQ